MKYSASAKYLAPAVLALLLVGCSRDDHANTATDAELRSPPPTTMTDRTPAGERAGDRMGDRMGERSGDQSRMPAGNPALAQLAEMGGAAEAAVELCDLDEDTAAAKRRQREQFVQMGGTAEQFDAAFRAGKERAKAEHEAADAAGRERMCDNFRNLPNQFDGMR